MIHTNLFDIYFTLSDAIASKATILKPAELNVPAAKFEAQFGLTWDAALEAGNCLLYTSDAADE